MKEKDQQTKPRSPSERRVPHGRREQKAQGATQAERPARKGMRRVVRKPEQPSAGTELHRASPAAAGADPAFAG